MPKVSGKYTFIDLSDYGRPIGMWIANKLKNTNITPIHVTVWFGIAAMIAIILLLQGHYIYASIFLIIKSILDAADGELSRVKNTPSYTGRYLDSIFDIIINFFLLLAIGYITQQNIIYIIIAFICIQLQGTLYNYYYVIIRNISEKSDKTSRIIEDTTPIALQGEKQETVNRMFFVFKLLYGIFDKIILYLDPNDIKSYQFPRRFMTFVSLYGLGFQLLIIAVLISLQKIDYIIPALIGYTILLPIMIYTKRYKFS